MKIAVFGLGYVGTVSAACFAELGHHVIGVDVEAAKVDAINAGRSPVVEDRLEESVRTGLQRGHLSATTDVAAAVRSTDVSLICVGTPSRDNGSLNLDYVTRVTRQIAEALRDHSAYHVVVFRSTMLPGTTDDLLLPILESGSGRRAGSDFGVAVNPEFLREGTSLDDFHHPPRTLIGELDERSGAVLCTLYEGLPAAVIRTTLKTAELVKYTDNSFHALKVAFANEIGNICKRSGIDSHELMEIFCTDTKLNLSRAYLKPGYAFGGSCLPKDLRALVHHARAGDVPVPILEAILASNDAQKRLGLAMILRTKKRRVGILGLSFKPGTDDLRESPAVELAETLIGKGFDVAIYDRNVSLARLIGTNRAYIEREIPHLSSLLRETLDEIRANADVLVVTTRDPEFAEMAGGLRADQVLIDLVRLPRRTNGGGEYQGISW